MAHSRRCVDMALQAIADNNGATLDYEPNIDPSRLTPETREEALEWLANGNATCHLDGEDCHI